MGCDRRKERKGGSEGERERGEEEKMEGVKKIKKGRMD